jgi:hypothetical protein
VSTALTNGENLNYHMDGVARCSAAERKTV